MGLAVVLKQPGQPTQKDSIFYLESYPSPKMWVTACWAACFPTIPDSRHSQAGEGDNFSFSDAMQGP